MTNRAASPSFFCRLTVAGVLLAAILIPSVHAQAPTFVGEEFQVNSYTTNEQTFADVARDAVGNFVVVWQSVGSAGTDNAAESIQARRFSSDGSPIGADFQVNTYTSGFQANPRVAMSDSGDFVVVWGGYDFASFGGAGPNYNVNARRFEADGTPIGDQFPVGIVTASDFNPAVAMNSDGSFQIVWRSDLSVGDDSSNASIQGIRYSSFGSPGSQFQVNNYTTAGQYSPDVAADADGGFVVAWQTPAAADDDPDSSIQARRFSSDGSPIGGDFRINSYTTGEQSEPRISMNASGEFVVSWGSTDSIGDDASLSSIQGRRFASDGSAIGPDFQVNTSTFETQYNAAPTISDSGDFTILWQDLNPALPGSEVRAQRFDSSGAHLGAEIFVNTYTTGDQRFAAISNDEYGDFIAVWQSPGSSGTDNDLTSIQAQHFSTGQIVGDRVWRDFNENGVQDGGEPGVSGVKVSLFDENGVEARTTFTDADGLFGFSASPGDYYLRFTAPAGMQFTQRDVGLDDAADSDVTAGGVTILFPFSAQDLTRDAGLVPLPPPPSPPPVPVIAEAQAQVNSFTTDFQLEPSIAMRPEGDYVVAWQSFTAMGDGDGGIEARRFASDGSPLGDGFLVNSYTPGIPLNADVALDAAGGFVVVWQGVSSADADYSSSGVRARRFASDGSSIGDQFLVNTTTTDAQNDPQVAKGPLGDFTVVWTSRDGGGDGSEDGIRGRRFASDGTAQGDDFVVNELTTGTQSQPAIVVDDTSDFVVVWQSASSPGDDSDVTSIQGRRFASSGSAIGAQFQINEYTTGLQGSPRLAQTPTGFVATWISVGSPGDDDSSFSIQARRIAPDGLPIGSQFQVNTFTTSVQTLSEITTDAFGRFVVAWRHAYTAPGDPDPSSVHARRFDADGTPIGAQFLVNVATTGNQSYPGVASDANGDFVVVWDSSVSVGDDASSTSIQSRRFVTTRTLGDRVWQDLDADGAQDLGEPGAENVTVALHNAAGDLTQSTTTDAQGAYSFSQVVAGDYFLQFDLPAGATTFSPQDAVADDALDSDAGPDGATNVFTFLDDDSSRDAGLISTSIGDRVWLDADLDGVQSGGEIGVAGVSVELFTQAGVSQRTTTTAGDGSYSFTDLSPGVYYLVFTEPTGFCWTTQDQGDDALDSDVDPLTGTTDLIDLDVAQSAIHWDAGLAPEASVGNRVWLDDGDGLQAGGESGVAGVSVALYASSGSLVDTTTTDADGLYVFSPGPGDYYLELTLPADTAFAPRDQGPDDDADSDFFAASATTSVFTLSPGQVDATRDAGIEPATIGNRVWLDSNGDGRQQPGEAGVAGVVVRLLDDADTVVASTTTDADGVYGFLGVATGDYRVEVVLPGGNAFTAQNVGGDDLIDSDVDPSTGRTALFSYDAGDASRSHDAGLTIVSSPFVFSDGFESGDLSAWSSTVP